MSLQEAAKHVTAYAPLDEPQGEPVWYFFHGCRYPDGTEEFVINSTDGQKHEWRWGEPQADEPVIVPPADQ